MNKTNQNYISSHYTINKNNFEGGIEFSYFLQNILVKGVYSMIQLGVYLLHILGVEIFNSDHLLMLGKLKRQSMMKMYGFNVNISINNNIMNLQ